MPSAVRLDEQILPWSHAGTPCPAMKTRPPCNVRSFQAMPASLLRESCCLGRQHSSARYQAGRDIGLEHLPAALLPRQLNRPLDIFVTHLRKYKGAV